MELRLVIILEFVYNYVAVYNSKDSQNVAALKKLSYSYDFLRYFSAKS